MKKYITPASEVISLATEQMLAGSPEFNIDTDSDATVDNPWTQKEDFDDGIDW